jgi:hypothetical protein
MYLTLGYVSFFKIHLGYIHDTFQDTMYLNPQIHDTQDTLTIHVGYIGIHSRIRISSPTCGHLLPRAEAVQRALSAQVGSDDQCLEEEGGAHGGEQSEGTGASPSARAPSGARLQRRKEAERLQLLGQQGR